MNARGTVRPVDYAGDSGLRQYTALTPTCSLDGTRLVTKSEGRTGTRRDLACAVVLLEGTLCRDWACAAVGQRDTPRGIFHRRRPPWDTPRVEKVRQMTSVGQMFGAEAVSHRQNDSVVPYTIT